MLSTLTDRLTMVLELGHSPVARTIANTRANSEYSFFGIGMHIFDGAIKYSCYNTM